MRLRNTVTRFATEVFSDATGRDATFVGKVNPFAEVANSGASSQRRILETPREEFMPESHVVVAPSSEIFIVGGLNYDMWNGSVIRHKYPVVPVTTMGAVGSIGETLTSTQPDKVVYAYPYFVRREMDDAERSDYLSGFEVTMPPTKTFFRSAMLTLGTDYYRFKTDTWRDGAGFTAVQAVKLEDPVQVFDLEVGRSSYNPVTDKYGSLTVESVECFVEDLRQDYEFVSPSFTGIEVGDKAISVMKVDATLGINDMIGLYQVLSVRDMGTWVTCQCRYNPGEDPTVTPHEDIFYVDTDGAFLVEDDDDSIYIIEE